jgi:uncharacterized protein YcbX
MTGAVTSLWRHPVKSHGREALETVTLQPGKTVPWDRVWAVTHDNSAYTGGDWAPCQNFMIGTRAPALAGLWAQYDEARQSVTLRHHTLGELQFRPDDAEDARRFLDWVRPLAPENRAQHNAVVKATDRGMTDSDFPSVSIMNMSSHRAVSQKLGRPLEIERWRGNIWFDGMAPWEEFDWIGKTVQIGDVVFEVKERIERCLHTAANPNTGLRDADTLGALQSGWDHKDFGVYAQVVQGGTIAIGDAVKGTI